MVIYLQVQHVKDRQLGFEKDRLIEIDMQHGVSAAFPSIKQDLINTGLVQNAAMSDHVMIEGGNTDDRFTWQGKAPDNKANISFRNITPEFISTYGIHIIQGRDFTPSNLQASSNVIINQSLARLLGNDNAVGKIIRSPRGQKDGEYENMTVIGVIDDYVYGSVYSDPGPVIFFNRRLQWQYLLYARLKPSTGPANALTAIEAVMKKDNAGYPLQYRFVDDEFNGLYKSEVLTGRVAAIFSVLAVIICCMGLFGLSAFTAEQRVKEIGIRKVLGASVTKLTLLLSKGFLQLVTLSCLIAFPVAGFVMHNWLNGYTYRVGLSWWIFALTGAATALIALATISFQTIKAALANPVKSLRTE
jgi:ABC-type antimicrobial peptide transport system permease subunit